MLYRTLAGLVVILHLLFILFVVGGGFLALRWRWLVWLHLPCAVWGGLVELAGWYCPLTPFENELRRAGGASGFAGSFVAHYLLPLIYPTGLTRGVQLTLGALVLLVNGVAYILYVRQRRSRRTGV